MRFSADITLKQIRNDEIIETFNIEYFNDLDKKNDYDKFLVFLSNHETLLEDGIEMNYEGKISVNGITKEVTKEFLNELYDALEEI